MSAELEAALGNLERVGRTGGRPSHYLARHVLLELGRALRPGQPDPSAWVARAAAAGRAAGRAWAEAVGVELSLACGEFAQCLDPRYIDLPGYDLAYTLAARERLTDRLGAARELGLELSPRETEVLALADRVLATLIARGEPAPGPAIRGESTGGPTGPERSSRNERRN